MKARNLAVGVLGYGAIGSVVADALKSQKIAGAFLAGVFVSTPRSLRIGRTVSFDELLSRSDLIVECAGHDAVHKFAKPTLESGCDLLLVSVGALADASFRADLSQAGPGRLKLSTGALGGIDMIRAATMHGNLERICLRTTKRSPTLIQEWMEPSMVVRLRREAEKVEVFRGSAARAAALFPRSANVSASLALATDGWRMMEVVIQGDPKATSTLHEIECDGDAGQYRFSIRNRPSSENAATSAVVGHAVLRAIADEAGQACSFR